MVAVDEFTQSGGGAAAVRIARDSAAVVSSRDRKISARFASVYRQFTLLPASPTTRAAPSTAAAVPGASPQARSAPARPLVTTSRPDARWRDARSRPMKPPAPPSTSRPPLATDSYDSVMFGLRRDLVGETAAVRVDAADERRVDRQVDPLHA